MEVELQVAELRMARLRSTDLNEVAMELIQVLFLEAGACFFALLEDDEEVAVVLPPGRIAAFPRGALQEVDPCVWSAISLCKGGAGEDATCVVHAASCVLSSHSISCFFLSSIGKDDFILVPAAQADAALSLLREQRTPCAPPGPCGGQILSHQLDAAGASSRLHVLQMDVPFVLGGFSSSLQAHCLLLLRFLFRPFGERPSVHFRFLLMTREHISILGDADSVGALVDLEGFVCEPRLRAIRLCDALPDANDQPGIVAHLTQPLWRASPAVLPFFAISTFSTDYVLVQEAQLAAAQEAWRTSLEVLGE